MPSDTTHCLSSDAAVKQILLSLNDQRSFIVEDLDDYHVVIKIDEEHWVRSQLEIEVRGYTTRRKCSLQLNKPAFNYSAREKYVQLGPELIA